MNKNIRLFAIAAGIIILIIVIAVLGKIGGKGQREITSKQTPHRQQTQQASNPQTWPALWGPPSQQCEKKKSSFSTSPIAPEDITVVAPMGELAQGHVVPGEHIGINYTPNPSTNGVNVFAPADGHIAMVERHQYVSEGGSSSKLRNYHVYIVHSCSLFTGFVHVTNLAPEILAANAELKAIDQGTVDSSSKNVWPNVAVKAGQVIGTANGFGLLGMVTVDLDKKISGYINPANYKDEGWRLNSVAPFDYFPETLKQQLFEKNARKAEPRGGKFDLDIDGKLVGSWFETGSGGIRGSGSGLKRCGNFPCPAQDGQVALVYDYVDPLQLRVSIGHNWGLAEETPYGVKGNAPDFKDVGTQSNLVKYELVTLLNKNKENGLNQEHAVYTQSDDKNVIGTALVQLTGNRQIKAELFPGKSASQVTEFSSAARTYER